MAKSLILCDQMNSSDVDIKAYFFVEVMESMDKGLTEPKWVLINRPKITQMPQNLSVQFVCPSRKIWDFNEKRLHWASVVALPK